MCPLISDIIYVVDGSETINRLDSEGENSFMDLQTALVTLTNQFLISRENVLMGLIQFSNIIETEVQLGNVTNSAAMIAAINGMVYQNGGSTSTTQALDVAANELNQFGRAGVQKQIILLTDGAPDNFIAALDKAEEIKQNGVAIIGIGINLQSSFERDILERIATDGVLIEATNVNDLARVASAILRQACPGKE